MSARIPSGRHLPATDAQRLGLLAVLRILYPPRTWRGERPPVGALSRLAEVVGDGRAAHGLTRSIPGYADTFAAWTAIVSQESA